jgi:hypothetical protein
MSTKKKVDKSQGNILSLFTKHVSTHVPPHEHIPSRDEIPAVINCDKLTSDNPEIQEFYSQLSPQERIAHRIAIDKLNTSYDVTRTHGFLRWKRLKCVDK